MGNSLENLIDSNLRKPAEETAGLISDIASLGYSVKPSYLIFTPVKGAPVYSKEHNILVGSVIDEYKKVVYLYFGFGEEFQSFLMKTYHGLVVYRFRNKQKKLKQSILNFAEELNSKAIIHERSFRVLASPFDW